MKKTTIMAAAILTTVSSVALAQASSTAPSNNNTTTTNKNTSAVQDSTKSMNLKQEVMNNLQQSGFTNIKLMPDSFLVQARDRSGNPVTMFIGPHSFDEVTTMAANNSSPNGTSGSAMHNTGDTSHTMTTGNATGSGMFTSVQGSDDLSSKVVGLDVYNNNKQDIGTIKDIAFNSNGTISGYVLSVGGFLGIGDHYVAVRPSAVNLNYNSSDNKWHATMNATADQLKAAPEYKYPSKT